MDLPYPAAWIKTPRLWSNLLFYYEAGGAGVCMGWFKWLIEREPGWAASGNSITGTILSEFTELFPICKCCIHFYQIKTLKNSRPEERGFVVLEPSKPAPSASPPPPTLSSALPSSSFLSLLGSHFATQSHNLKQVDLVIEPWDEEETGLHVPLDRRENRGSERPIKSSYNDRATLSRPESRLCPF